MESLITLWRGWDTDLRGYSDYTDRDEVFNQDFRMERGKGTRPGG